MTTLEISPDMTRLRTDVVDVEVVVPVYNEAHVVGASVRTLCRHLAGLPLTWRVTVADNASTDGTAEVASAIERDEPGVRVVHLDEKGRGRALRQVWSTSDARVVAYMDVDLSTDLNALLPLVAPLLTGHSDVAIGTRLAPSSQVVRGPRREVISRCYNLLLRSSLRARFSDAQCGFKAMRREAADALLPYVHDDAWFFDTELLVLAERAGMRIHEVPVDWTDDPDSRVDVWHTAVDDIRGIVRVGGALLRREVPVAEIGSSLGRTTRRAESGRLVPQVVLFAAVGIVSTIAYALVYLGLVGTLGAQGANAAALLLTAVGNTAANRRITFGVRGRAGAARHQAQGLVVLGAGLLLTSAALWSLHAWPGTVSRATEVLVLTVANLCVTVGRFAALRWWVFRR